MTEDWGVYEEQEMESDDSGSRIRGQAGRGQDGFSSKETSFSGFGGQHGEKARVLAGEGEGFSTFFEEDGAMGSANGEWQKRRDDDDDREG